MLTEARLKQLAENERREHRLAETAAEVWRVMVLTCTLGEGERLTTVKLGRWAWLSRFDADEVAEFVEEMANALISRDAAVVLGRVDGLGGDRRRPD
jgi:hypothetical protein